MMFLTEKISLYIYILRTNPRLLYFFQIFRLHKRFWINFTSVNIFFSMKKILLHFLSFTKLGKFYNSTVNCCDNFYICYNDCSKANLYFFQIFRLYKRFWINFTFVIISRAWKRSYFIFYPWKGCWSLIIELTILINSIFVIMIFQKHISYHSCMYFLEISFTFNVYLEFVKRLIFHLHVYLIPQHFRMFSNQYWQCIRLFCTVSLKMNLCWIVLLQILYVYMAFLQ